MSILNLLIILSYGILVYQPESGEPDHYLISTECNVEVSANITQKEDFYIVTIDVKNSTGVLKYFFFNTEILLNTEESSSNEIKLFKKGQYLCVVKDDECDTKIEFVI